ncbi:MAG: DNA polymerase III subunit beta, partial [Pseudomonadota bacterium]
MKFSATREQILGPLQSVIGVVERKQTMPVLANVLLAVKGKTLSVTGTDLEVELVATGEVSVSQPGEITVPGRKLLEIAKTLPEKATITVTMDGEKLKIVAGRSRFVLTTLS